MFYGNGYDARFVFRLRLSAVPITFALADTGFVTLAVNHPLLVGEFLCDHLLGPLHRAKHVGAHGENSRRDNRNDDGIFNQVLRFGIEGL